MEWNYSKTSFKGVIQDVIFLENYAACEERLLQLSTQYSSSRELFSLMNMCKKGPSGVVFSCGESFYFVSISYIAKSHGSSEINSTLPLKKATFQPLVFRLMPL